MNKTLERRLDFLKMEAKGFSLCEIVKELSVKWCKTERTVYYDAETRGTWQPLLSQLFQLDKARLMLLNRYEYLYRKASFNLDQCNDPQKPTYLKLMLDITNNTVSLLGLESLRETTDREKRMSKTEKMLTTLMPLLEAK